MYWNSMCISSVFSILRWYQILVFPCLQDFFFKLESKDGVVCLIWLHWVLVAAWGLLRKIKKIVFRKTILTSSIRSMPGPTVATLTWSTALCETTTIRAAAPMLKERVSSERPCAVRIHLYAILEKAGLWDQQTWLVLGLFEVSVCFGDGTLLCSHCGDSYTHLCLLKLLEPYICIHMWVSFCVSSFFLFVFFLF